MVLCTNKNPSSLKQRVLASSLDSSFYLILSCLKFAIFLVIDLETSSNLHSKKFHILRVKREVQRPQKVGLLDFMLLALASC